MDLQRGRAQADLTLHFALRGDNSASVSLRGAVKVSDVALADRAGAPLAAWRELKDRAHRRATAGTQGRASAPCASTASTWRWPATRRAAST